MAWKYAINIIFTPWPGLLCICLFSQTVERVAWDEGFFFVFRLELNLGLKHVMHVQEAKFKKKSPPKTNRQLS
jgi:hypothetical protein